MIVQTGKELHYCPILRAHTPGVRELCKHRGCMAWRTVDGDPEVGFCGMVPVLPYQLRDGGVGQVHGSGPEIVGRPRLSGGAL